MAENFLGNYKSCVSARATDKEILKGAQDGGIVTQLFAYALETGIIDGAIVAGPSDEPWKPRPMVAMTKDDLLKSRGTRYNLCPSVSFIKEATRSYGLDKVGIVGVPCQVQAVRKGQTLKLSIFQTSHSQTFKLSTSQTLKPPYVFSPPHTLMTCPLT